MESQPDKELEEALRVIRSQRRLVLSALCAALAIAITAGVSVGWSALTQRPSCPHGRSDLEDSSLWMELSVVDAGSRAPKWNEMLAGRRGTEVSGALWARTEGGDWERLVGRCGG